KEALRCRLSTENERRLLAGSERSRVEGRFTVVRHIALAYSVNMQLVVNVSPEAEKILEALAARNGRPATEIAGELLEETLKETYARSQRDKEGDFHPDAIEHALARVTNGPP